MYHSKEVRKEIVLQDEIKILKSNIKEFLNDYFKKELDLGILSDEEKEEIKYIYSVCLGKLNETFYRYNIGTMMKVLRDYKIVIPSNNIINLLDVDHLKYYKSMLSKYYNDLVNSDYLNPSICISKAESIAKRAKNYFNEQHYSVDPFDDLLSLLLRNKLRDEKIKKESNKKQEKLKKLQELNKLLKESKTILKEENEALKEENKMLRERFNYEK